MLGYILPHASTYSQGFMGQALIRRRMLLDMEEKGLSDKEIREKYGIADNRTLRKHLGLAEKEREVREARIKILSDNQTEHLAEIRTTIEQHTCPK